MGAKPSFVAPSQPLEKSLQELIQGRGCQLDDYELQPFANWSQFWHNLTCQLVVIKGGFYSESADGFVISPNRQT